MLDASKGMRPARLVVAATLAIVVSTGVLAEIVIPAALVAAVRGENHIHYGMRARANAIAVTIACAESQTVGSLKEFAIAKGMAVAVIGATVV